MHLLVTIDLDSTICEVHGKQKQGASYGYIKVLGLHPLIASLSNTQFAPPVDKH